MSDSSPDPKSRSPGGPSQRASAPRSPPPVPDYELLRRIGRGAYGEVWLARSVTGAFRAVKIVHRQSFYHDRPFEREFEGILKFEPISRRHDSQVDILHVGRSEDCFYYVMELADDQATGGQINPDHYTPRTLKSELLFHGRLPFEECVRIGIALATALENLHGNGLVHRDVKPSNIIFVNGVPKLADIGLVTGVDATRSYVGTEGFAAPEGPGTTQADLYSLGKVLYEIATGKDRQEFPELPTLLRELPDRDGLMELNAVIAKACRHDPKDRYPSAATMRRDLQLLQGGKSLARLHRIQEKLRFVQRAGAVVTAVAGLIAAGWLWQARETHLVRELAADKSRLATERTQLAAESRERLVRLNVANGVREMDQGDLASSLLWLGEALKLTTNNSADTAVQRIRINHLLARQPRLLHVFPHPANVQSAEFSPDEQHIVTACMDGSVRIWDMAHDEKPVADFPQEGPVGRVRFTRDGRRLFVVQPNPVKQPGLVAMLDATTGLPALPPISDVTAATLSPDDRWLAVARSNFVVQVIAADTGQVVAQAAGHADRVESINFSPDSAQLLTASRDRTVRRWQVATGKPIGSPLRHAQSVVQAVFNCDTSRIATATAAEGGGTAIQFQTWDAATGAALGKSIPGDGVCTVLAFDLSGHSLLAGDTGGTFGVRDADSHAATAPPLQMDSPARGLDFSPDGALVAVGSDGGNARIWDLETGRQAFPPLHHAGRIEHLRFNGDGSRLLTASDDGTVKVWELGQVPEDGRLSLQAFDLAVAAVSRDGRQALLRVSGSKIHIQLVDLDPLKPADTPIPAADAVYPEILTFDRTGNRWAAAPGPSAYEELNPRTSGIPSAAGLWRRDGDQIRHFSLPHEDRVRGVFFHEDGSQVLTVGDDRVTRIWNTADGSLRQAIRWPDNDLAWVALSPDLRTAVALCRDAKGRHFLFREVQTGKRLGPPPENHPDINAAMFSPDGTRLATAGDNQCGRIWDARTGQPLTPEFKHGGSLSCVEWSPDGRRVLTAGVSPEVKVWDAVTGGLVFAPLAMKAKPMKAARFSADGRFIVASSDDKFVRVWDAATGEAVTPLLPHEDHIRAAFVTAAPQLVTVSVPCVVRVWNLAASGGPDQDLADYARLLAGGSLTPADSPPSADAGELVALLRSVRSRQPRLFASAPDRLREWHRRQARGPRTGQDAWFSTRTLGQVRATVFHLERLARLAPADTAIADQLKGYRAALIPPRDPGTPPQLLDLTRAYTHSFDLLQFGDLAELPRGRQKLGGIEYDLRGLIQLDHRAEWADYAGPFHPVAVVVVGQRCRALRFLQATYGEPRIEGSTVARWIIHYADGSACEWPVIYGDHVRDWWWWVHEEPLEAKQATVVWRGRSPIWDPAGAGGVRLFQSTWTNPQPDLEITRLEYRIGETALKPIVVAVTAE